MFLNQHSLNFWNFIFFLKSFINKAVKKRLDRVACLITWRAEQTEAQFMFITEHQTWTTLAHYKYFCLIFPVNWHRISAWTNEPTE